MHSIHGDLGIEFTQDAIVKIPIPNTIQYLPSRKDRHLHSSPLTSSTEPFQNILDAPDAPHVAESPFPLRSGLAVSQSPSPSSSTQPLTFSLLSDDTTFSESGQYPTEHHSIINGMLHIAISDF